MQRLLDRALFTLTTQPAPIVSPPRVHQPNRGLSAAVLAGLQLAFDLVSTEAARTAVPLDPAVVIHAPREAPGGAIGQTTSATSLLDCAV